MGFNKKAQPKTLKFSKPGTSIVGVVVSVDTEAQMTFTEDNRPNGLRFDANGNVVLGTVVTLALPDKDGAPTDELVKLRVGDSIFTDKGREVSETTSGLKVAIQTALGDADLDAGDTLTITYVEDAPAEGDRTGAKVFDAIVDKAE